MTTYDWAVAVELGLAGLTFALLWLVPAPYGRHLRPGWGPTLPARFGWLLMELPAPLGFLAVYAMGTRATETVPLVLAAMWQLHYLQRTLVFPFRLPPRARPLPVVVVLLGFAFNLLNASINAWWVGELGSYAASWLTRPPFLVGTTLFLGGMVGNLHADSVLLRLKRREGYGVPHGGLYRWVSCPNYLAEMVEWWGWALATCSLAGVAFALYTVANLVPRAMTHHRWYRDRFPTYPRERRALIPYLL